MAAGLTPQIDIPFEGRLKNLSIAGLVDRRDVSQVRLNGIAVKRQDNTRRVEDGKNGGSNDRFAIMEGRMIRERLEFQVDRVREPASPSADFEDDTDPSVTSESNVIEGGAAPVSSSEEDKKDAEKAEKNQAKQDKKDKKDVEKPKRIKLKARIRRANERVKSTLPKTPSGLSIRGRIILVQPTVR